MRNKNRKTVSYLNHLKRDVEDVLESIATAGADVDASAYDLSGLTAHDLVTSDAEVKELFDILNGNIKELKLQVDAFKGARDKYVSFFGINHLQKGKM